MSTDDYVTYAPFPLALAPSSVSLLIAPALAHEVAHPLISAEPDFWAPVEPILSADLATADEATRATAATTWGRTGRWTVELACDAVATYLFGAPYPWQHLQHMLRIGSRPFVPNYLTTDAARLHPADLVRVRTCAAVLDLLGVDAGPVGDEVAAYVAARGDPEPSIFGRSYPDSVVRAIAESVVTLLRARGVVPAAEAAETTVATLVGQAWVAFLADAGAYPAWEATAIDRLSKSMT
jgi:hypothetical protein